MYDEIVRAIADDGMVKIAAISSQNMCERARKIHDLTPVAAAALGRLLSAASMMGNELKETNGSVTLQMRGGGPIGLLIAVADANGDARGCVANPDVELPTRSDGKLDVGGAVGGDGYLTVIKDLNMKEPYIGSVQLVGGEIAEDLAAYFAESEQIPTAVALGVLIGRDRTVSAAGGYILQLLPGAPDALAEELEAASVRAGAVTKMLSSGLDAEGMINAVLAGHDVRVLQKTPVSYRCHCSRERMEAALISLGRQELTDLIAEQHSAEMTCRFCDAVYRFTEEELAALMEGA